MAGKYRPVSCREFKAVLRELGFSPRPQTGTSHEQWTHGTGSNYRRVTVDCPKAPFTRNLLSMMLHQAGTGKNEFYTLLDSL